jgi:hypothetical protein
MHIGGATNPTGQGANASSAGLPVKHQKATARAEDEYAIGGMPGRQESTGFSVTWQKYKIFGFTVLLPKFQ